ncbi:cytochrome c [Thalassotalea sp. G2M2-11]|uniref:c-type cytochrome n=1 Tax=Thalassotalea sp. G2M2-11 TaxID=2787627 RepID=UPI0019D2CDD4|nr:cytochrome c [Thalassotalea sp. G2M2-11]
MKKNLLKGAVIISGLIITNGVYANTAQSEKHAQKATELRQSIFKLLGSNMGPLGAMAKGKIAFDNAAIEKHATRINQLSLMIDDYTQTDTSKFKVKTDALTKVWTKRDLFEQRINDLTNAADKLIKLSSSNDKKQLKQAIIGVGKTCGGCHDDFKAD